MLKVKGACGENVVLALKSTRSQRHFSEPLTLSQNVCPEYLAKGQGLPNAFSHYLQLHTDASVTVEKQEVTELASLTEGYKHKEETLEN